MTVVRKSPDAFRTISEVSEILDTPAHVLRFWESRFTQIRPVKRGGGRRYYRPQDIDLLRGIRDLLYEDGLTIKGVQKILGEKGVRHVVALGHLPPDEDPIIAETTTEEAPAAPRPAPMEPANDAHIPAEPAAEPVPDPEPADPPALAPESPAESASESPAESPAEPKRPFPQIDLSAAGHRSGDEEKQTDLFAHADLQRRRPFPPDPARAKRAEQLRAVLVKLEALREKMARDLR